MDRFSRMLAAAAVVILLGSAEAADLYVAPGGNDAHPGTKDQPFASLERARDAAREAKAAGAVTVHVGRGRYELARPLEFTAADSGTKERPVTWLASEDEKPIVSGGTLVTGWRRHDDTLWAADVPWVRERGRPFYQLFVNGQRRVRARMPNEGSYFYTRRLQANNAAKNQLCFGMTYRESDLAPLQDAAGATVVLFHNWVNSFNRIGQVDRDRHRIMFARPAEVAGKEGAAEAVVTDREPASGTRCLRFVDAAEAAVWKPHWCVQRTPASGTVRMQRALKNDPDQPATIGLELRDWAGLSQSGDRYLTGPCLRFNPDGSVQAAGPGEAGRLLCGRHSAGVGQPGRSPHEPRRFHSPQKAPGGSRG